MASWAIYNGIIDTALISDSIIPDITDVGNGNSFQITYQIKPEELSPKVSETTESSVE